MAKKMCHRCSQDKPTAEFHKAVRNKDGLNSYCKTCSKEYAKAYMKTPKGKELAHRSYRKQADRLGVKPQERFRQPVAVSIECPNCREFLPPHHFYSDGSSTWCIMCIRKLNGLDNVLDPIR